MGSDDGVQVRGRQRWKNELRQIREQKERKDKIESEWHEGLWLRQSRSTNETILETAEGVVRAYATRRQDADERWKGDFIKKLHGTPARPDPNREQTDDTNTG